jgi:uncharacterized protein YicC (UPF0701 family)
VDHRAADHSGQKESENMTHKAIIPPRTYSEWVEALDLGTIEWQSGVAERFAKKLTDTINTRMNAATDKFQKDLNNARGAEGQVIQALLSLRKEMQFLSQAINLPAIPEKDRGQYYQLVRAQADSMQSSLEDSAKKDRSGKMSSIVRNHKVNAF